MQRFLFLLMLAPVAFGQTPAKIRLLICGDDGGAAQAFNEGTILAYRNGVMRCANVLTPGPWFPDMARRLNETPGIGVGVHLTLTSEWDGVKWLPLTGLLSLGDENGYLPPTTRAVLEKKAPLADVEREIRAQIELAKRMIKNVGWVWAHMGTVTSTPELRALTQRIAHEYGLGVLGFDGSLKALRLARGQTLKDALEKLEPGDWFFIEHPSTNTPETSAIGHAGSPNIGISRSAVVQMWTDPALRTLIENRGIELLSFEQTVAALKTKEGR